MSDKNPFELGAEMGQEILDELNALQGKDRFGNITIKGTSPEAVVNAGGKSGETLNIGDQIAHANEIIRKKENLSEEEKSLRDDLDALMGKANFRKITKREDINRAMKILRDETLKKIKTEGKISGSEEEKAKAVETMYALAEKKAKSNDRKKTGVTIAMGSILAHLKKEKIDKLEREENEKEAAKKLDQEKAEKEAMAKKVAEDEAVAKKLAKEEATEKLAEEKAKEEEAKKLAEEEAKKAVAVKKKTKPKTSKTAQKTGIGKSVKTSKPVRKGKDTVADAKIELTPAEKADAVKFFDQEIVSLYELEREKQNWTGYRAEVGSFLKEKFVEKASKSNIFDGDELKIAEAWEVAAADVESKVEAIEKKIKEKDDAKAAKESEFTLEQVYEKLTAAGASDEDVKHFFNLVRKERMEILNSSEDELTERIKDLAEKRKESNNINNELARDIESDRILGNLGKEVQRCRKEYLEKEDDIKIKISRLKKFFKNFVSVDKSYEVEKELVVYKEEYKKALKNYLDAIVEVEKPADAEEREIVYRYAQFGETLKLMEAKVDMKFEKNPIFEKTKNFLKVGASTFIDKYKELLGKPKELIMKKTDSKILGFGGGMIAVGGAMAFAANYIPGLRDYTRVFSIAVATKGFYSRAESKAVIEKEKLLEEGVEKLESRLEYINNLGVEVDEAFKKELGLAAQNIPEEAMKEKEAVGRRMAWSLGKAILVSTIFYEAGHFIKGYFQHDIVPSPEELANAEAVLQTKEQGPTVVTSMPAGAMHSQVVVPIGGGKNIDEIMAEIGINRPEQQAVGGTFDSAETEEEISTETVPTETAAAEKLSESVAPEEIAEAEKSPEDMFTSETPDRESFVGIELDDNGIGKLKVIEGTGIKDTLAKMLMDNSEKFTEGKMGWDADKYASVAEWADERAVGIVGELKEQYPNYNFDKVSTETTIFVDLSDRADIKIVGLDDPYHLGGESADIAKLEGEVLRSNILETAEQMTNNEMRLAYATGVSSEEYAKINHLTVAEFLGSNNQSTQELRDIVATINATEDDPTNSVAETLRGINTEEMDRLLESKDLSGFNYDDYLKRIVREELLSQSEILKALNDIKDQQITVDNPVFREFREAAKNTLGEGFAEFEKNQTVREFLVESVKRTYEMGKIDAFRTALSHIKL